MEIYFKITQWIWKQHNTHYSQSGSFVCGTHFRNIQTPNFSCRSSCIIYLFAVWNFLAYETHVPTFLSIPTVSIYWYLASTDFRHPIKCDNIIFWAQKYTCGARIVRPWKDWNNIFILIDDRIDDAWFSFVQFIHFDIIRSIDSMNLCNNFHVITFLVKSLGVFECIPWKTQFSDSALTVLFWFNAPQLNFRFLSIFLQIGNSTNSLLNLVHIQVVLNLKNICAMST